MKWLINFLGYQSQVEALLKRVPTEIARRVARRHQAAVALRNVPTEGTRVE